MTGLSFGAEVRKIAAKALAKELAKVSAVAGGTGATTGQSNNKLGSGMGTGGSSVAGTPNGSPTRPLLRKGNQVMPESAVDGRSHFASLQVGGSQLGSSFVAGSVVDAPDNA